MAEVLCGDPLLSASHSHAASRYGTSAPPWLLLQDSYFPRDFLSSIESVDAQGL